MQFSSVLATSLIGQGLLDAFINLVFVHFLDCADIPPPASPVIRREILGLHGWELVDLQLSTCPSRFLAAKAAGRIRPIKRGKSDCNRSARHTMCIALPYLNIFIAASNKRTATFHLACEGPLRPIMHSR